MLVAGITKPGRPAAHAFLMPHSPLSQRASWSEEPSLGIDAEYMFLVLVANPARDPRALLVMLPRQPRLAPRRSRESHPPLAPPHGVRRQHPARPPVSRPDRQASRHGMVLQRFHL